MRRGIASLQRVLGALAKDGRGGHVAAGFPENAVVQKDTGYVFAARGGVDDFLQAFIDHIAVALHGEHDGVGPHSRSEEHTSELQSLMRISYAVFCLTQKATYT